MKHSTTSEILLVGVPFEWQSPMKIRLESEEFTTLFSLLHDEATEIIQSHNLCAVIITSDFIFGEDVKNDLVSLTYGKIPTLTIILRESFEKFGQDKIFDKIYNPEAFQEFCTAPFDMDELLPRLRKVIQKAETAFSQK
ncbi:MAG: hypothetical protein U0X74_08740 [Anaerolineales bacterium]